MAARRTERCKHWHCCLLKLYAQYEHIRGRKQPARFAGTSSALILTQSKCHIARPQAKCESLGAIAVMQKTDRSNHEYPLGPPLRHTYLLLAGAARELRMSQIAQTTRSIGWRTPAIIILCGCLISLIGFGPRSAFGFFLTPMSQANGWGRDVFALAFALQNLLWGIGQPFAGAVADRFGMVRVLSVGAILYTAGLALMAYTTSPLTLQVTAGVLVGFGLSGCSFNLVIAAFGKLLDQRYRALAIGAGTAAGSFGQFLFAPFGVALIDNVGWQNALLTFGSILLLIVPLALALATPPNTAGQAGPGAAPSQSLTGALTEAFGHRSYMLLVFGFFTCGFQLAFITLHLPSYLIDRGLSAQVGGWTLATIGLFNIIGCVSVGWLSGYYPRRYLLATNYFLRAVFISAFVLLPASPVTTLLFAAGMGLMWL